MKSEPQLAIRTLIARTTCQSCSAEIPQGKPVLRVAESHICMNCVDRITQLRQQHIWTISQPQRHY